MKTRPALIVLVLLALLILPVQQVYSAPNLAHADVPVYAEGFASGWEAWGWAGYMEPTDNPVHWGSTAMRVDYGGGWEAVYFHYQDDAGLIPADFTHLRLYVHGGSTGGHSLSAILINPAGQESKAVPFTTQANAWSLISIPISSFEQISPITGIWIADKTGNNQPVFYLDDITLIGSTTTQPTQPPAAGITLTVNTQQLGRTISPYIYGMNFADEAFAREIDLPVNRWGGNATTRYNYQNDTSNRGSDWYFENVPNDNNNRAALPNSSDSDEFIDANRRTGTDSLITIPLIGWAPKGTAQNPSYACGFSRSTYGDQTDADWQWRSDCGNGVRAGGGNITGNNPADTSIAIGPSFVQDWLRHLQGRYGTAAQGGVRFYNLDNEPMLWHHTHRDVHPTYTSYNEIRDRTYQYAAAIKAADPQAQTLGPVLWGWTAYFYSALDTAAGGAWWNNPTDRNAHGGIPFVEWYLQQMAAYEGANGVRILDYLDLHYYPQSDDDNNSELKIALTDYSTSATNRARRLRSTRSLWDPAYIDDSWINEQVNLIPRMRAWVDDNYPGTKLAITEYNWGAMRDMNGALAQTEVLGIFGREGLDLATLWWSPEPTWPTAYAFRMYRNYDGNGSQFGDISLPASSSDWDKVSIFAARRSQNHDMTLMIVNKSTQAQTVTLNLTGYQASGIVQVYRYSSANPNAIVPTDSFMPGPSQTLTLPANSITLVVVLPDIHLEPAVYLPLVRR